MRDVTSTPARVAAEEVRKLIASSIDAGKHFLVEAGAGAGKTFSLIDALQHVIKSQGRRLMRFNQRVACITYTNVAKDEIDSRTDRHPVIEAATIHGFLWSVIRDFQPFLRSELPALGKWAERIKEAGPELGDISKKPIEYNLGYPKIDADKVLLYHDDVTALAAKLLANSKFRHRLNSTHPLIFIDEYQDTDATLAEALKTHVLSNNEGPQIGLFGDHWQAIYDGVCGRIEHPSLVVIPKGANFRSVPAIVNCLNKIRVELPQEVDDTTGSGTASVYHTNDWPQERRTGSHWQGDLPADAAIACYQQLVAKLANQEDWEFQPTKTKVLMLTHSVLATQQGYASLADAFSHNDAFVKKEDSYVKFFADTIEPAWSAFQQRHFGDMLTAIGGQRPPIDKLATKELWNTTMAQLGKLRQAGTIGDVVAFLTKQPLPELRIPDELLRKEKEWQRDGEKADESLVKLINQWDAMKLRPYAELSKMIDFIEDKTPFSTKHGVKGAEFENVLVVIGRGWSKYNFNQYLEWVAKPSSISTDKCAAYERNRNLFYVACSRPRKRLALLFTQKLSTAALKTLADWFGQSSIHALLVTPRIVSC